MPTIKARIEFLEKLKKMTMKSHDIYVHLEGDPFVTCNGKKIPLDEWEKMKSPTDQVIRVTYAEDLEK